MKIIALDTATEACSAALLINGELRSRYELTPRRHTALILPMLQSLLDEAGIPLRDLDVLAFGRGPGSFTGVRIAAAVAQGVAWGAGLPVIPVSTLAAMAQRAMDETGAEKTACAIDARMREVYWGCYLRNARGLAKPVGEECVIPPADVPLPDGEGWTGAGSGWGAYTEALQTRLAGKVSRTDPELLPHAAAIARLAVPLFAKGATVPATQALPVYLRDKVARVPAKRS